MPSEIFPVLLIALGVTVVGLGKGGLSGIGMLGMPIVAMALPPVEAAAFLLPIMLLQDAFSVWLYRTAWNRTIVGWMLPGSIPGIVAAALFAASVSVTLILALLGILSILFSLWRLWVDHHEVPSGPFFEKQWPGAIFGFFCGFTSQLAHMGAPPLQAWLLPKKLPHREFVGTSSIVFALINLAKVPAFLALGAFSRESMTLSALFIPVAAVTTFAGAWLVDRISGKRFYMFANVMLMAIGAKLVWGALP